MGRLTGNTVLRNPETGNTVVLHAGEELPAWAVPLIGAHLLEASGELAVEDDGATDDPGTGEPGDEVTVPWVVVEGDLFLGSRSRFVASRDKAVEFDTAEDAQARLEEIQGKHPDAHIEASGELAVED